LRLREMREARAVAIAEKFEKKGINGVLEGARAYATGEIVSRTHFARYLQDNGYVSNFQAAFKKYLRKGKPCYVPCDWCELEEAVGWIKASGGQAVVAHPARYQMKMKLLEVMLVEFKAMGGAGLEVVAGSHTPQDVKVMAALAENIGLLGSVGSDFHDPGVVWRELGRVADLPEQCTPVWHDWQLDLKSRTHKTQVQACNT